MECLAFLVVAGIIAVVMLVIFLGRVKCPHCRRRVERDSTACPCCGRELEPELCRRLL